MDPGVCVTRIARRGEARQAHETESDLAKLRDAYLLVARVVARDFGRPVLVLDGGRDLETVVAEARDFASRVHELARRNAAPPPPEARIRNHG